MREIYQLLNIVIIQRLRYPLNDPLWFLKAAQLAVNVLGFKVYEQIPIYESV